MPVIPMFPLGTVLFPYARLPLHVFEPRYRLMTRHVMEGDKEFGVVLIERGSEVGGGDVRFEVATVAQIVHLAQLPDGRSLLETVGLRRIRVLRWLPDDPYPRAEVEACAEPAAAPGDDALRARVIDALAAVHAIVRRIDEGVGELPDFDDDPRRASYELAALAPIGPLDAQRVLSAPDTGSRLTLLASLVDEQCAALRARFDLDE
jgi:Lon protease-like protein